MISCVSEREKHLIHSNRYVSQSISLPYNWPQRSPSQSRVATFYAAQDFVALVHPRSTRHTKLHVPDWNVTPRLLGGSCSCISGSCSYARSLKWFPLILPHAHRPCRHAQPVPFSNRIIPAISGRRLWQFGRLQTKTWTPDLAGMTPPLISVFWPLNCFLHKARGLSSSHMYLKELWCTKRTETGGRKGPEDSTIHQTAVTCCTSNIQANETSITYNVSRTLSWVM